MAMQGDETWPIVRIDGTELRGKLLALQHFMQALLEEINIDEQKNHP